MFIKCGDAKCLLFNIRLQVLRTSFWTLKVEEHWFTYKSKNVHNDKLFFQNGKEHNILMSLILYIRHKLHKLCILR